MSDFIFENKLIYEKSPYLLNHAHTPVNWFPWGKEALSLSKEKNKPIFLSIGGISPSWHSLIFEEIFTKEDVARLMNCNFINIKMDKEEYPHLAHLYLDFSKILSSGSVLKNTWPLNIILTPDLFPFFSVHCFSVEENFGTLGISELIEKIVVLWEDVNTREHMIIQSHRMLEVLSLVETGLDNGTSCLLDIKDFISLIYKEMDLINGGVKSFPKYLNVSLLRCLLHFSIEHRENKSLFFVNRSLDCMSRGSIFDHIRGGFYRCTVDESWLLPSLEKLSTENASLSLLFLEMYALTKEEDHKKIALSILNYLVDNLRDPETHLFYLSESTNFEGSSSFSHTCSYQEIQSLFGEDANLFCEYFSVHKEGLFDGRNMLKRPNHSEEVLISKKYNLRFSELKEKVQGLLSLLKTMKEKSVLGTFKNTQNIVYANGFIAYSLVQAGLLLGDMTYITIAEDIITFIQKNMYKNGLLLRICGNSGNEIFGCLEDYAAVILSSIALFEAGRGNQWLYFACSLMDIVTTHFKSEHGGFYSNHDEDPYTILRRCNFVDNSIPSENSLIAEALIKFYFLFDDSRFLDEATCLLEKSKIQMKMDAVACASYLTVFFKLNVQNLLRLVILLDKDHSYKHDLECLFSYLYFPNKIVIWLEEEDLQKTSLFPKKLNLKLMKEKTTMFLFEGDKTSRFVDPNNLREYLSNL